MSLREIIILSILGFTTYTSASVYHGGGTFNRQENTLKGNNDDSKLNRAATSNPSASTTINQSPTEPKSTHSLLNNPSETQPKSQKIKNNEEALDWFDSKQSQRLNKLELNQEKERDLRQKQMDDLNSKMDQKIKAAQLDAAREERENRRKQEEERIKEQRRQEQKRRDEDQRRIKGY